MIMPNKYIQEHEALIGVGAVLLECIPRHRTVSALWDAVKDNKSIFTYERFILGLDFLFLLGVIVLENGQLTMVNA